MTGTAGLPTTVLMRSWKDTELLLPLLLYGVCPAVPPRAACSRPGSVSPGAGTRSSGAGRSAEPRRCART